LGEYVPSTVSLVEQSEAAGMGTAAAVAAAAPLLRDRSVSVLVIYGDTPLLSSETMQALVRTQQETASPIVLLSAVEENPAGRGRIVREESRVLRIVEERDATPTEKQIKEFNTGIMCFAADWLWEHLPHVPVRPNGERYLTDLAEMAVREGAPVECVQYPGPAVEVLGINDRVELARAEKHLRHQLAMRAMHSGVTLIDPATTWIDDTVEFGQDIIIYPNCHLYGRTVIADDCVIGPNTRIQDSRLAQGVAVTESVIEGSEIGPRVRIGPFAHLRPGTVVEEDVAIGNYAELKNTRVGAGTQVHHVGYLGDATIGKGVNIGAGTITCNYDGVRKHPTVIGDAAFIGSNTLLVAPVQVGQGALTGAGSVVTRDIPPGAKAYGVPARVVRPREPAPAEQMTPHPAEAE